jgi:hypothetical protein
MYFSASLRFVLGSQGVFQYCFALSAWNSLVWCVATQFLHCRRKEKAPSIGDAPSVEY